MSRVLSLLALLGVLYAGLCAALWLFQRALIYFPQPLAIDSPGTLLKLQLADAEVAVSVRPRDGPKALIYFGGNAEDVSLNLPEFARAFPDHALYLMHYRGFGGSSGSPSEAAIQGDALALFDRVHAAHRHTLIVGRSLGAAVAVRLASQRPAARLVLITPFHSLQALAAGQFPYLPVKWLLRDRFEAWKYAAQVAAPTLLIVAEYDQIVPRASSDRLYAHFAPGVARLAVIPDTGHNSISVSPRYLELLRSGL